MKKVFAIVFSLALAFSAASVRAAEAAPGTLIKASTPAVYYYALDGKRYVFPNEKTYKTWYSDFSQVVTVSDSFLASLQIAGNITYRPGVKMVKIDTDPKVYAVSKAGTLRWVKTEAAAVELYGADWNKKIDDIPDAFFTNYNVGQPVENSFDFIPANETAATLTIDSDKGLSAVTQEPQTPSAPAQTYVWNKKTTLSDSYLHKNLTLSSLGSGFLAAWNDDRNGQNEIYFEKMNADGSANGSPIRVSSNISDSINGKGIYDGNNIYFLWEDSSVLKRAIYLQRHDVQGNQLNAERVFVSSTYATSQNPDFSWSAPLGEYGLAWWDTKTTLNGSVGDIYFSRMKDGLKAGDELRLSAGTVLPTKPAITADGDKFGIVWQDGSVIKFALAASNSTLSGTVKDVVAAGMPVTPKIAWSGQKFAVVWAETNGVYFSIFDESGNAVSEKVLLASGGAEPDIAWSGEKFYVAYSKNNDIYAAKVVANGNVEDAGKNISNSLSVSSSPKVAVSEGTVLISWLENAEGGGTNSIMSAAEALQ